MIFQGIFFRTVQVLKSKNFYIKNCVSFKTSLSDPTFLKRCILKMTNIITKKVIYLIKLVYFLDYNTCILGFGSLQVIPFCTNLVLSNQVQLDNVVVVSYSFRKYKYTDFRPLILGKKRFKNFKYQHIHFLNSRIYKKPGYI